MDKELLANISSLPIRRYKETIGAELAEEIISLVTQENKESVFDAVDEAYNQLGDIYTSLDMYNESIAAITLALDIQPETDK